MCVSKKTKQKKKTKHFAAINYFKKKSQTETRHIPWFCGIFFFMVEKFF